MTWFHDHVRSEFQSVAGAIDRLRASGGAGLFDLPPGSAVAIRNLMRLHEDYGLSLGSEPITYEGMQVVFEKDLAADLAYVSRGRTERILVGGLAP